MEKENKEQVLISIIIATFNAEKYISRCLTSIFDLSIIFSFRFEVIVMDGGSIDRTAEIVSGFNRQELRWNSKADNGIYDAMNKGVAIAKGRWLYFMGADDRLLPGFVEIAATLLDENTVYYGNSIPEFEDMPVDPYGLLNGEFSGYRLAKYCMNHQSILYPSRAFLRYKYELKYRVAADYAFNLRLWGDEAFKKVFYPFDIVIYNMGGFSAGNRDVLFYRNKSRLILEGLGLKVFARYIFRAIKDKIKGREGV